MADSENVSQHRIGNSGDKSVVPPIRPDGGYDATDSRRNAGSPAGWSSVDDNAGSTSDSDFGSVTSRFPDGGGWKQT